MKYNWTLEIKPNPSNIQVVTVTKINPINNNPVSIWTYPTESINEAIEDMKNAMKHDIDINQKISVELTLNELAELAVCYGKTPSYKRSEWLKECLEINGYNFKPSYDNSLYYELIGIFQNTVNF